MTKKEKQQLTPDFNNKLLKGLYVHDLFELLEQVGGASICTKDTFTFEELLGAMLKSYELATLRAKQ